MIIGPSVKAPTIPIPYQKLLTVVAIVDRHDPQMKALRDEFAAANVT
ncbi:hypothetical protein [Paraburkholderia sp. J8-2]|nr:hypothetical protein [Paraburkholderia sp. J8-2]